MATRRYELLTFEKGLFDTPNDSVIPNGYAALLQNWEPRPHGGVLARRGWINSGTDGAPATRRCRGIGLFTQQAAFATVSRRQSSSTSAFSTSVSRSWGSQTAQGNCLLAAVVARTHGMSIVQSASAKVESGASITATWPAPTTAGNFLMAMLIEDGQKSGAGGVDAPAGWTQHSAQTNPELSRGTMRIYFIEAASSRSGGEKFTYGDFTAGAAVLFLYEIAGAVASGVIDQAGGQTQSSGTTISTGTTGTTVQDDEFAIAVFGSWKGESGFQTEIPAATFSGYTNGFSEDRELRTSNTKVNLAVATKFLSTTGTQETTATKSDNLSPAAARILTLKASAALAPPVITPPSGWTSWVARTNGKAKMEVFFIDDADSRSGSEPFSFDVQAKASLAIVEYQNVQTAPRDIQEGTTGESSSPTFTTLGTTAIDNEMAIAFLGHEDDVSQSDATSGFSRFADQPLMDVYDRVLTIQQTVTFGATLSASAKWMETIVTLKAAQTGITQSEYLVAHDDGANFDILGINDDQPESSSWTTIDADVAATSLERDKPVMFAMGLGHAFWTHQDFTAVRKYDGATVSNVAGAPPGRTIAFYRNRIFIGGTEANPSRLWFSDLGNEDSWPVNNFIDVGLDDGEPIQDIAPLSDGLIIAKEGSLWFLSGTGPTNFELHHLDGGDGMRGRCIAATPYGAIIAGKTRLWFWGGGPVEPFALHQTEAYAISGDWVSTTVVGHLAYICDPGTGDIWVCDPSTRELRKETVDPATERPAWVLGDIDRLLMGPIEGTTISLLAYRSEESSPRQHDPVAQTFRLHTPEYWFAGPGVAITPRHLYIRVRQRGGTSADPGITITPVYEGTDRAVVTVPPRDTPGVFALRLDVGSARGIYGVKFKFEQTLAVGQDSLFDIEQVVLALDEDHLA